ncbi:MAG: hypothetical protein ACLT2F_10895 [Butyricicoccus sp.]
MATISGNSIISAPATRSRADDIRRSLVLRTAGAGARRGAIRRLVLFLVLLCSMSGLPVLEKHLKDRSNHFEVHLELKNKGDLADFVATSAPSASASTILSRTRRTSAQA